MMNRYGGGGRMLCFLAFCISLLVIQCSGPLFDGSKKQGTITYKLSFPYNQDNILVELFPQQMTFEFKNSVTRSVLKSLGDVVRSEVITDNNQLEYHQYLKSYENKYLLKLDEQGVNKMLSAMPAFRIEATMETDSVAGYLCKKSIAYFLNDSVPPITLLYTEEILIENPNWWNQFHEVKGVLLAYEIEQYGMRVKLEASKVSFEEVESSHFEVPEAGQEIDTERMQSEMKSLADQFQPS